MKENSFQLINSNGKLEGISQTFHEVLEENNPDKLSTMHWQQRVDNSETLVTVPKYKFKPQLYPY